MDRLFNFVNMAIMSVLGSFYLFVGFKYLALSSV
jgi:hypothetical protein